MDEMTSGQVMAEADRLVALIERADARLPEGIRGQGFYAPVAEEVRSLARQIDACQVSGIVYGLGLAQGAIRARSGVFGGLPEEGAPLADIAADVDRFAIMGLKSHCGCGADRDWTPDARAG